MKKFLLVSVVATAFAALPAFAHHMAEDVVDPDVYAMIDANLEAVDSPHLDLDLSTIPSRMTDGTTVRERMSDIRTMPTLRPTGR